MTADQLSVNTNVVIEEAARLESAAANHRCVFCGSPDVNLWKSWNLGGEWTCDECAPEDYRDPDEDWI